MDAGSAADTFIGLFSQVYLHLYPRRAATDYRPSPETLALLIHLIQSGPVTVLEAAAHFERSQAAMSEMLDRLIRRGLLDKIPDERDRRRHLVWLTEAGQQMVRDEQRPLDADRLARVLSRMTADERATLVGAMSRLVEAATEDAHPHRGDRS